jgi:DNA-binding transcriptional ArsR family regulator
MSAPFEEMSSLDRLVHEPARLAILTALSACKGCDYVFLQSLTALTQGNLSGHLSKLEEGGLVELVKGYKGRVPQTTVRLTAKGRTTIDRHWRRLRELHSAARQWDVKQRSPQEE